MMTPADYRLLPYRRVVELVQEDATSYFVARVLDIPWIRIDGDTPTEALLKLDEIFDDCIASLLERGREIPAPTTWPGVWGNAPVSSGADVPKRAQGVALSFDLPDDAAPWASVASSSEERAMVFA